MEGGRSESMLTGQYGQMGTMELVLPTEPENIPVSLGPAEISGGSTSQQLVMLRLVSVLQRQELDLRAVQRLLLEKGVVYKRQYEEEEDQQTIGQALGRDIALLQLHSQAVDVAGRKSERPGLSPLLGALLPSVCALVALGRAAPHCAVVFNSCVSTRCRVTQWYRLRAQSFA